QLLRTRRRPEGRLARDARRLSAALAIRLPRTNGYSTPRHAPRRSGGFGPHRRPPLLSPGVPHRTRGELLSRSWAGSAPVAVQHRTMARDHAAARAARVVGRSGPDGSAAGMVFALFWREAADRDSARARSRHRRRAAAHGNGDRIPSRASGLDGTIAGRAR